MKKPILFITLLTIGYATFAQTSSNSGYPKINLFHNPGVTITLDVVQKTKYKYIIDLESTEQANDTVFVAINNDYETFKTGFGLAIKSRTLKRVLTPSESDINREADRVYYFFRAAEILAPNLDYRPVAGHLQLSKEIFIERNTSPDHMIRVMAKCSVRNLTKELRSKSTAAPKEKPHRLYWHRYFPFLKEKIYQINGNLYSKQELKRKLQKDLADSQADISRRNLKEKEESNFMKITEAIEKLNIERRNLEKELKDLKGEIDGLRSTYEAKLNEVRKSEHDYERVDDEITQLLLMAGMKMTPPNLLNSLNFFPSYVEFRAIVRNELSSKRQQKIRIDREVVRLRNSLAMESNTLKLDSINDMIQLMLDSGKRMDERVGNYQLVYESKLPRLKEIAELTTGKRSEFAPEKARWDDLREKEQKLGNMAREKYKETENCIQQQAKEFSTLVGAFERVRKVKYKVNQVEIEFNAGFIENVLVTGEVNDKVRYYLTPDQWVDSALVNSRAFVKFENRYPIGFSRKRDYENLNQKSLFTIERNTPAYRLRLENLIRAYVQQHAVNRRDFSPADTLLKVTFDTPVTSQYIHPLYKDATYRLFEARIFSDFVGLNQNNPNGLIQTEIDKNIALITSRFPRKVFKYEMWNFGFLSSITPTLTLSKIEDNNRQIPILYRDEVINGVYSPTRYASTLELKRHENFSVGFDVNLVLLDIPTFKSTFFLDYGFRYGRVAVIDSLRDYDFTTQEATPNKQVREYGVNTMQFYPRINWLIKTDERYSFNFSGSVNWYFLRSNEFEQVANEEVFADSQQDGGATRRVFANVSMLATLKPSPQSKGKLFFRYQYNWQWNYANTGFHQAQVGYSFYLLSNRK